MTRRPPRTRVAVVALAALSACAHAKTSPAPELAVVWPEPPEAPRVRLTRVVPAPPVAAAARPFWRRALDTIVGLERAEEAPRPLERPFGVAIDAAGGMLVADPDVPLVARVSGNGTLRRLDCAGDAWAAPMALAPLPDGAILVADAGAARVVRIGTDGRCTTFAEEALERPTGIAVSGGRVYIADPPQHVVLVVDTSGAVVARLGTRGDGDGQLSFPTAVAAGPDGEILVVDALNFRIARFAPDGQWRGAFGSPGEAGGSFARPKGVAVGADGRIYVSDAQRDLVLVFLPDGSFEYSIGESGSSPGNFAHPAGLVAAGATLYVADSHNARVQGFDVLAGGGS